MPSTPVRSPLRTVLIFAHECAPHHRPESTAGAQRPAQFAKHLPAFGWRVIVICCDARMRGRGSAADLAALPSRVLQQLAAADPEASVVIATPSLPYDGLLDRCWRCLQPQTGERSRWKAALRKPLTVAKLLTGDYSQSWQPFAGVAADAVTAERSIDACIGEHGPDAGLFLARRFSRRYGVPWIADFRDPILRPFSPAGRRIYAPLARRLLRTASATINVTPVWAESDAVELGRPSRCIPNGFDPDDFRVEPARHGERQLSVAYIGSIHTTQRMDLFFDGLRLAADRLEPASPPPIRFVYRGSEWHAVNRLAGERGLGEIVDARPHVDRAAALAELRGADVLLLLSIGPSEQDDVYCARGLYPAKTFEYFGAERPILCVPGDGGVLERLVTDTGTGAVCRTGDEIAGHLVQAARVRATGQPLRYGADREALARFTRYEQARQLSAALDDVESSRARRDDVARESQQCCA